MKKTVWAAVVCAAGLLGQQNKAPVGRGRVVWVAEDAVSRAGARFRQAGQERWRATVQVKDGRGGTVGTLALTMEWPGKLALEGAGAKAVFTPAGLKGPGALEWVREVAEVLLEDTLDGFLTQHLGGGSTRIVGTGYPDPGRPGSSCDVVVVRARSRVREAAGTESKQYWFDNRTKQLVRVIHPAGGVEARLGQYAQLGGSEFPGTVTVLEKGAVKYAMTVTPAGAGPGASDGTFDGR